MLLYASFLFLVFGAAWAKSPSNEKKANCTDTNSVITLTEGQHAYINCQSAWDNVSVTVDGGTFTDGGLSLDIASVTNFADPKALKVYAVSDNNTDKLIYEGLPLGTKLWMVTGQKKIKIVAKAEKNKGSLSIKVVLRCGNTFDLPTFVSPLLPNQPLTDPGSVTCSFNFTKSATIDFTKFSLANTSEAKFVDTSDDSLSGPFVDKAPDHTVIVKPNSVLRLKLDLNKTDQIVSFTREVIGGPEKCGGKQMTVLGAAALKVDVPSLKAEDELTCAWLLVAPEGKKLTLSPGNISLGHVDDLVSVVDGGNFSGTPLLQMTALNRKSSTVISSGRYLVVSLDSKDFGAKEGFGFEVSVISSGGNLRTDGTMLLQENSRYNLITSDAESLVVQFTELTSLKDTQEVVVMADSVEIVKFDAKSPLFDLASPGSELQIVANGFPTTGANVNFTSVPKGSGCLRTSTSAQATGLRPIGKCDGHCLWVIKPNVPKEISSIFMKILPNNVPEANITHLIDRDGKVRLDDKAEPFMISYKTADGAYLEFDCSNAKDFELSYVTKSESLDLGVTALAGRNFTLTSPFFPGIYPQGGLFKYNVSGVDSSISYFATVSVMDLLKPHNLTIGDKATTQSWSGSDLPGDVLIPGSSLSSVVFDSSSTSGINPKGTYGFHIDLSPASSSQTLEAAQGSVATGNKCNDLRCVYIIKLNKPEDVNSSVSVNLTVTIPKDGSLKDGDLLVWDGDSVLRSELIAPVSNLTKGGLFASRSNKLIVVYKGGLNITLSYVSSPCSFGGNTMCLRDRLCMPISWRCDQKLRCSDGSDEWLCTNGRPPTPQPEPAPASSSGWKVAFWLFMPLFILLGVALDKGVPMLIQRLRDSRYQQFHDLGDH